jgi:Tfp pilus assembly protein FimT
MAAIRRWLSARELRADDGFTLAELLVTVALTTLVAGFTFTLLIQGVRSTGSTSVRQDNAGQGRVAIEAISRNLRTAIAPALYRDMSCSAGCAATTALTAADGGSVTFYANLGGVAAPPSRITYAATGTTLMETVQAATVGANSTYSFCTPSATCAVRTRTLVRGIVPPTAAQPLFTYYRDGVSPTALTLSAPATAAELTAVDSVDVLLKVRTSTKWGTPATTVAMRIALPNADYGRAEANGGV